MGAVPDGAHNFVCDKGGLLGRIFLHVFFYVDKVAAVLLVLGAINKDYEGPIRKATRNQMRRRLRQYRTGKWRMPE